MAERLEREGLADQPAAPGHSRSILIVDDEPGVCDILESRCQRRGWRTTATADAPQALAAFAHDRPDVVLLDVALRESSGLDVLRQLRETDPTATVVMLSGSSDIDTAVASMLAGADNFLTKPFDFDHLDAVLERAYEKSNLRRRNRLFARQLTPHLSMAALGGSAVTVELARQITLLAEGNAPILITGETGSGKGHSAELIHACSSRAGGPFISINCAELSSAFLHTELFGHESGAFTDARGPKQGLFELADGGTLLLDEIGDLAPELQPKLLTVLETGRFRRLGGVREIQVDVRVIAATHTSLSEAMRAGQFRSDLYYRLAGFPLNVPALRDRGHAEVADLAMRVLGSLHRQLGRGPSTISPEALELLSHYSWPGNVRELKNVLERVLVIARTDPEVWPSHLPPEIRAVRTPEDHLHGDLTLAAVERHHIERVLKAVGGNRRRAAQLLAISRQTLYKRLSEYGLKGT